MRVLAEAVIAAFDSNAAITWTTDGPSVAIASFTSSGVLVTTRFSRISNEEWQVGFDVATGRQTGNELIQSSIRVFSGVFQSVREFLEVRQPVRLVFTSKEESLASLYENYLERQDTTLAQLGYFMETPSKATPLTEFVIRKKTPSEWRN